MRASGVSSKKKTTPSSISELIWPSILPKPIHSQAIFELNQAEKAPVNANPSRI